MIRDQRKNDHIDIAAKTKDGPLNSGFADLFLINQSVSDLAIDDIDLTYRFIDKELSFPVVINALTGGTDQARRINKGLAELSSKYGLAMAVGSQTIALEDPGLRDSFRIVRDSNPNGTIIANVGATCSVSDAMKAIEMVEADALQLHFNIPQELAMREGDRDFRQIRNNVRAIVDESPVPIIAKEVGFGLSRESVAVLYDCGVRHFDNSGSGGTNFISIEGQRSGMFGSGMTEWGIPTAVSIGEICSLGLPIILIASGGIRTPLDGVRALAMGADLVGIAGPLLKLFLREGIDKLDNWMDEFLYSLKAVFLMNAARDLNEIKLRPLIITGMTAEWLRARGIDPAKWSNRS